MARTKTPEAPRLLTVEEAAPLMRCGRSAAYERVRRGDVPSVRFGRKILIPETALLRFLAGDGWQPKAA